MKKRSVIAIISISFACLTLTQAQPQKIHGFEVTTLTPFPSMVGGVSNPVISLNGEWEFHKKESEHKQSTILVPGEWEMQGFKINEGETAVYSKQLKVPADWKGKRVIIRFDAVSSHALVKINGKVAGEHEGSFVPFEVDITPALTFKTDLLIVEVQALTISDRLACTSQYACHTVGGLLRKVTLFAVSPAHIAGSNTFTVFDSGYKNAMLNIATDLVMLAGMQAPNQLLFSLIDTNGTVVLKKTVTIKQPDSGKVSTMIRTKLDVRSPKQWNPEHPNLYTFKTELIANGTILQSIEQKIGFRQVVIQGNLLMVNGMPVKLHGVNRHSVYPLTGRSISPELERKDAQMFREANCNYIRTSHYPPSEEFLNAADELGLFVESEASLCWIQHHASPIWRLWTYTDEKYLPFMVRANLDNVQAGRNHPSVIIWSLGNESRWSPLWVKVLATVKELDPSRPTAFHDQCWGGFNNAQSKADIANYHYPGLNGPAATDTMSRPTLFGEYSHLTTYNRRELLTDPGVRSAYNAPLVLFYDSIYKHSGNLGGAIWSGIDDIFHMPDGRIVGYGPWGPLDAWRRPKPEYWGMKKAYTPVRVTAINRSALNDGSIELTVENRYDFTSLKEVKIEATADGITQQITSAIHPHGEGFIRIPCKPDASELYISFTDPRGFIANEEHYDLAPAADIDISIVSLESSENESSFFIKQGDIGYTISKTTGIITGASKNGVTLLTRGPVFCVVPMNGEDGGKPNVAGETYQNNIYPLKNYPLYTLFASGIKMAQTSAGISISMEVTYTDGKGKQSYLFSPDGRLVTEYEVFYTGEDSIPYQYGLLMELPKYMDRLDWKRKGEFTTYPANDIARIEGTTKLNAKPGNGVEVPGVVPQNDWKDDANELGSNDFRSTKRFIRQAVLSDQQGNRITGWSDGSQYSRSWLQDEHIQWLIADYSNTGSEPFYGSPHSDGRIRIKNKTLKGKLVLTIQ